MQLISKSEERLIQELRRYYAHEGYLLQTQSRKGMIPDESVLCH